MQEIGIRLSKAAVVDIDGDEDYDEDDGHRDGNDDRDEGDDDDVMTMITMLVVVVTTTTMMMMVMMMMIMLVVVVIMMTMMVMLMMTICGSLLAPYIRTLSVLTLQTYDKVRSNRQTRKYQSISTFLWWLSDSISRPKHLPKP